MVQPILQQFDDLFKVLDTFDKENFYDYSRRSWMFYPHKGNVRIAADTWHAISELWLSERDTIRTWLTDYSAGNKQTIYDKYYMDAAWKLISDNLNHNWCFQIADDDFLSNCPDLAQWRQAEELVRAARQRMDFSNCDDEEILHRHDGEPCNAGFICVLCEEMEHDWRSKVEAEVRATDNIFLNVASRAAFAGRPVGSWTGPPVKVREPPNFPPIGGKTPFQAMKSVIDRMWSIRGTFMCHRSKYEQFIALWTSVDYIDQHIGSYISQVDKIISTL